MLLTQLPRTVKITIILGATLIFLLFLHVLDERPLSLPGIGDANSAETPSSPGLAGNELAKGEIPLATSSKWEPERPPCQTLPGADDVVVVMRTGASEIKDKLPVSSLTV